MLTPSRLTLARTRRGLTAAELARKSGVSAQAINAYERGQRRPKPSTTEALAAALGFPSAFFTAQEPARPQWINTQDTRAAGAAQLAIEFGAWLERMFVLPQPDLPRPRSTADDVRKQWRLGGASAPNMVQLLESRGVRVFSLPVDCAERDAFSCWHNGTPFVFLNPTATAEQSRFDAATELGTLLGHDEPTTFAAEFLMPAEHLRGTHHRHWHVAKEAFAQRTASLGVTPLPTMHNGMARRESSKLLTKVFKALRENGTTPHQVARELMLGLEDLNGLVFGLVLTAVQGGGKPGSGQRARLTLVH